jgi:non-ribosomal peptide synthetase component F
MLQAAGVSALVTDEQGYHGLPGLGDAVTGPILLAGPDGARVGRDATTPATAAPSGVGLNEPRAVSASQTAYILFTSGSTGRPKGLRITHANLDYYFTELDARYRFDAGDVFSQVFDPAFDCAIFDLFAAWGAGSTLVSVPPWAYRDMTGFVTEAGITVWYSTPAAIAAVARRGGLAARSMPTLRLSTFAGDALKAADAEAWQRAAPQAILDNLYGPAETTITCTVYRWSPSASPDECLNDIVPIGALHSGHQFLLLDEDGATGTAEGELCVSGPQVTPGYLDPADDAGRFFTRQSRRWYRTGDRMRLADNGDLLFLGRTDNQVQIQGWRTELAEIDHRLRGCAGVQDAVTVGVQAGGRVQLVAFYTGAPTTPAEFSRQLLVTLPQQMLPRHFRHLDEMPLSVNRKIDRQALRQRALELLGQEEAHDEAEKVSR